MEQSSAVIVLVTRERNVKGEVTRRDCRPEVAATKRIHGPIEIQELVGSSGNLVVGRCKGMRVCDMVETTKLDWNIREVG